jgi:hypothetical protein
MSNAKRRLILSGVGLLLMGTLAVVVVFSASTPASATSGRARSKPSVAADLLRNFAVLRRGHVADAAAALPTGTIEGLTAPEGLGSQFGLDVASAQSVTVDGIQVWVIPGSTGVCTLALPHPGGPTDPGGVCSSIANAEAGKHIQLETSPSGNETIIGLAPDGATHATVVHGGTPTSVPVVSNIYVISGSNLSGPTSSVTVTDAAGHAETHGL